MSFKTIRDIPLPNPITTITIEDVILVCDADGASTFSFKISHLWGLLPTLRAEDTSDPENPISGRAGIVAAPDNSERAAKELLAADGAWYPLSQFPNSKLKAGVVSAGGTNAHKVWKTDDSGNPGWRADDNTTYSTFTTTDDGLVPKSTTSDKKYLAADGTWTSLPALPGVFAVDTDGLVPGPSTAQVTAKDVLAADGNWIGTFGQGTRGLVPAPDATEVSAQELLAADGSWYPISQFANTKLKAGVVSAGGDNANKVWKTDDNGNPGWRVDANDDTTYGTFTTTADGLVPKSTTSDKRYLAADGTWNSLPASPGLFGVNTNGLVPGPSLTESQAKELLAADGAWYSVSEFTNSQTAAGVVAAGGAHPNSVWATDSEGNPSWVEGGAGGASVTTQPEPAPTGASDGDLWFNETTGELYVYIDGTGWVQTNGGGSGGSGGSGGGSLLRYPHNAAIFDTEANILARTGDPIDTVAEASDTEKVYAYRSNGWKEVTPPSSGITRNNMVIKAPDDAEHLLIRLESDHINATDPYKDAWVKYFIDDGNTNTSDYQVFYMAGADGTRSSSFALVKTYITNTGITGEHGSDTAQAGDRIVRLKYYNMGAVHPQYWVIGGSGGGTGGGTGGGIEINELETHYTESLSVGTTKTYNISQFGIPAGATHAHVEFLGAENDNNQTVYWNSSSPGVAGKWIVALAAGNTENARWVNTGLFPVSSSGDLSIQVTSGWSSVSMRVFGYVSSSGSGGSGGGAAWSTGWVNTDGTTSIANGATMTFPHSLNSTDLVVNVFASTDSSGSSSHKVDAADTYYDGRGYEFGAQVVSITTTSITIKLAADGYRKWDSSTDYDWSNNWIKVVASSGGGGGGTGGLYDSGYFNVPGFSDPGNNYINIPVTHNLNFKYPVGAMYLKHTNGQEQMLSFQTDEWTTEADYGVLYIPTDNNSGTVRVLESVLVENETQTGELNLRNLASSSNYQLRVILMAGGGGTGGGPRAYISYNAGTLDIFNSYNISSITDISFSQVDISFSSPVPDPVITVGAHNLSNQLGLAGFHSVSQDKFRGVGHGITAGEAEPQMLCFTIH